MPPSSCLCFAVEPVLAAAINSNKSLLGDGVKVAILTPIAMSAVAIGMMGTFLFSPQVGLPSLLSDNPVDLFQEPTGALTAVSIAHVWGGIGFSAFIFLRACKRYRKNCTRRPRSMARDCWLASGA